MARGYDRAKLLRGRDPGPGREAKPDGLDRSDPDGLPALADAYLLALEVKGQSPRTVETRRRNLTLFLCWAAERGLVKPKEIERPHLESYQRHVHRHRKADGEPLAPGTQIGRLAAARGLFRWLVREGRLGADPAAHLEMPKERRRLPKDTPTEEEIAALMGAPDTGDPLGIRDRALLELLYSTGVRRTEATRLEVRDLNAGRGTLFVGHGKGGVERVAPVGGRALAWLARYLAEVRPRLEIDPAERALFLTGYGHGFSPGGLGNTVTKYVRSGLGRRGGLYLLRHACATHMLERGADVRVIQQLLGHAKLETTQVYTEVSIRLLRDVHARTHPAA